MRTWAALLLAFLALIIHPAPAARADDGSRALVDSLHAWHRAGRIDRVDSIAGPAIDAARAEADTALLAELLLVRGAGRAARGRARSAEPDLREARALSGRSTDAAAGLRALRWLAVAVGQQGRSEEARALYRELEDRARAAADSVHLGWSWVGIAYDHYLAGRSTEAAGTYGRAAGVLDRHGEIRGAMWAWNGRGLALRQAGDYRSARRAFASVHRLAVAIGDPVNEATALVFLGRLELQMGDPAQAERLLRRAAAIHGENRQVREALVPAIDLAQALVMQGRYEEAEAGLDSAATAARSHGLIDLEVLAQGRLADALLARRRPAAATAVCRRAREAAGRVSRMARSEIELRLASALAARDSLSQARAILASVRADGAGAALLAMQADLRFASLSIDLGEPGTALEILDRTVPAAKGAGNLPLLQELLTQRGRALRRLGDGRRAVADLDSALAVWERVRFQATTPDWREQRGAAVGDLVALAVACRLESSLEPDRDAMAFRQVQRYKARTLRERIRGPARTDGDLPDVLTLADLRRHVLGPDEILLDLVEGDGESVLFCVARDTVLVETIPGRRELRGRFRRLADTLHSPDLKDPAPAVAAFEALYAAWPENIRRTLRSAEAIVWCPDGRWHEFPLAFLGGERPRTPNAAIWRVPSATILATSRAARTPNPAPLRILALDGPVAGSDEAMPGAVAEVRYLRHTFAGVEHPARDEARTADWSGSDIIHLAAHTRIDPWQPWLSGVVLAPEEIVRADSIAAMPLRARLVYLSGCTTVGDRNLGGEGLIGVAGAFLAARTDVVVATLWPVDDAVAAAVATEFYGALARGVPVARALADARGAVRANPDTAAPRHWAGFVAVGDGRVTLDLARHTGRRRWPALLAVAALVVLFTLRKSDHPV